MADTPTPTPSPQQAPAASGTPAPSDEARTRPAAAADPGALPVTALTQELRIATTITGGVSLAIWMGGVVRELNLLLQASNARPVGQGAAPSPAPAGARLYGRLLDFLDVTVDVDMISGTSAGGINAVFLGLAHVHDADLDAMRAMWLDLGQMLDLLREPRDSTVPSLLYGDEWMYRNLIQRLDGVVARGGAAEIRADRLARTRLHVTTTLLSGEEDSFVDSFGTLVPNTNHRGVFTFSGEQLADAATVPALALAARSTASFPGAFEPSFVPVGETTAASKTVPGRPDMGPYANFARSHWVADGGVLDNMPLGLVLDDIFDRPAERDVRRVLLYVVPTTTPSGGPAPAETDAFGTPYGLLDGLLKNVSAVTKQSVTRDLDDIRHHNDRVLARRHARLRLLGLGDRADGGGRLLTVDLLGAYTRRRDDAVGRRLVEALLATAPTAPLRARSAVPTTAAESQAALLRRALDRLHDGDGDELRAGTPLPETPADFAAYGRAALDGAKAIVLAVLHAALDAATRTEQRLGLLTAIARVHEAAGAAVDRADLQELVDDALHSATTLDAQLDLLLDRYRERSRVSPDGWTALASLLNAPALHAVLDGITLDQKGGEGAPDAAAALAHYAEYLFRDADGLGRRLFDLSVTEQGLQPYGVEADQLVELIQVSADTATALAPGRPLAQNKLTGLQLRNFGAFYKRSWRANDWMWGRLDGAGWLVHLLLDPRRLARRVDDARVPLGRRAVWARERLAGLADLDPAGAGARVEAELAYLDDPTTQTPPNLKDTAIWLSTAPQSRIAIEEVGYLAHAVREDPSPPASVHWADAVDAAPAEARPALLATCPVPDETFSTDRRSPLMLRTITKAAATATAAAAGVPALDRAAKPVLLTGRTLTRAAYSLVSGLSGRAPLVAIAGVVLVLVGVPLATQQSTIAGIGGLAAALAGGYVLALVAWQHWSRAIAAIVAVTIVVLGYALTTPAVRGLLFGTKKAPGSAVQAVYWLGSAPWHPLVVIGALLALIVLGMLAAPQHSPGRRR